jgi:hypothetical protein
LRDRGGSLVLPDDMTEKLGFLAEFANQVLIGLHRVSDGEWAIALERASANASFIGLAHRLAVSAVEMFEEEHGPAARRLVEARLDDLAALFPATAHSAAQPASRGILAQGLLLASMLHGSRGFTHGAFLELSAPFRDVVDLATAERIARETMSAGQSEFSAVVPRPEPEQAPDDRASDAKSA